MKTSIGLLWVALLAVGLATLLDNPGVVSLFWYQTRLDISLNALLVALLLSAWLLVSLVRLWDRFRQSAQKAKAWRQRQQERHVWSAVLDGITHLLAGKHARAQDAAREALTTLHRVSHEDGVRWPRMQTLEVMAHWVLAEVARLSQQPEQAESARQAAMAVPTGEGAAVAHEALQLRAVEWALQDQNWSQAQHRLQELTPSVTKRVQVWRMKLRLARALGQSHHALDAMKALAKLNAFSARASASLYAALAANALRDATTKAELSGLWSSLDRARHTTPEVLCAYVLRRWSVAAPEEQGAELAAELFKRLRLMDAKFDDLGPRQRQDWLNALEPLMPHLSKEALAWVQELIDTHVDDPWVQYMAISAWAHQGLWGRTQKSIDALLKRGAIPDALVPRVWLLKAAVAEAMEDEAAAQAAWKKAAQLQAGSAFQLPVAPKSVGLPFDPPRGL